MQKILIAGLMSMLIGISSLNAQIGDKLVPHFGFMYEVVNFFDLNGSDRLFNRTYYTISLGTYMALAHANDVASVGVDAGVNFGINFPFTPTGTSTTIVAQVPVFLMGRLGANSTKYNQQKIGVGAGIGLNYTYFSDIDGAYNKINSSFFNPSVVGEVTILTRGNTITGRAHFSVYSPESAVTGGNRPDINYQIGNWGIGLIYGF